MAYRVGAGLILAKPILAKLILTKPILTKPILTEPILTRPILTRSIPAGLDLHGSLHESVDGPLDAGERIERRRG